MGTRTGYSPRVPRAAWTPNEEQKKLMAAIKRAKKKWDDAEMEYKALLAKGGEAELPVAFMSQELGVERKTIYRHLGRSMT
jgi:transcriptional regulator of acetoin/glycerol metabolism